MKRYYKKLCIVGYIVKETCLLIEEERYAVKGKTFVYYFDDSVPYYDIFPGHFAPVRLVDKEKTKEILSRFPTMTDRCRIEILRDCVDEIEKLDRKNEKEHKTCLVLRECYCKYQNECLRQNL